MVYHNSVIIQNKIIIIMRLYSSVFIFLQRIWEKALKIQAKENNDRKFYNGVVGQYT